MPTRSWTVEKRGWKSGVERERERETKPRDKSKRRCSGGTWNIAKQAEQRRGCSLLCFTRNVVKWRLTTKWTRGCVTAVEISIIPLRGRRGLSNFQPVAHDYSVRAVLFRCKTNANISIGDASSIDEWERKKSDCLEAFVIYIFFSYVVLFNNRYDHNFEDNL